MIVNKAYRYRIYPTREQKITFAKTFGCVRFIYNKMLSDRIDYYKETGQKLNNTPAQYKEEFPWLKEVDSLALANAQMNLNKAYHNFLSNRKHFGKPRFKSKKNRRASYSTNNQKGSVRIEGHKVKLPKVGWVKLCQHRPLPENSIIKTVTISQTPSGKYYISMWSMKTKYSLSYRRLSWAWILRCTACMWLPMRMRLSIPISCERQRRDWLRHSGSYPKSRKKVITEKNKGCV